MHFNLVIESRKASGGNFGFRLVYILFGIKYLTLQIMKRNSVIIDDGNMPHPAAVK